MIDQLRKLIDEELQFINAIPDCDDFTDEKSAREFFVRKVESIIASQPAVSVKAGWYAKDFLGVHWFERKPTWFGEWDYEIEMRGKFASAEDIGGGITDPWETSHPNGGPECIMEVK